MDNLVNRLFIGRANSMRLLVNCLLVLGLLVSATNALAQETRNRTTYYHNTLQGTPVAATNEAGSVKWSQTYSSYGFHNGNSQEIEESSLVFGTSGHVEDQFEDRLLVYQKARYYDPALGRFLSIDPVDFLPSNPQSFNRYAYVNNNPTTYVDPDGRLPFLIPVVIFLGKEIAAEVASRATDGATDFLSVRRLGTKAVKAAAKGVKSLRKKSPCGCFDADTPVLTADGHKPISEVELGELLVARNEFTGEVALKPVTELLRYEDRQFYELELIDEQGLSTLLDVTDDHPFWVENVGWVDSDDLEPGMLVRDLEGNWLGVKSMLPVEREGLAYNFEVGDFHTYFVGESDVWVHNCPEGDVTKSERVRHFTNSKGSQGIQDSNTIKASDQNSVFTVKATGKPGSPRDVEQQLGIGRGKGNNIVEFDANPSEFSVVKNPATGATERVFKGDVDLTNRNATFRKNR